jgi:hypothetical protein
VLFSSIPITVIKMEEISRWSPDSDELSPRLFSRPSTPQSVKVLLRAGGSPLRALRSRLSLTGLSVRSRKSSPDREDGVGLNGSHVAREGLVVAGHNRRPYRALSVSVGSPFQADANRALDFVQHSLSPSARDTTNPGDPAKRQFSPFPVMMPPTKDGAKFIRPSKSLAVLSSDTSRCRGENMISSSPSGSPKGEASRDITLPKPRVAKRDFRDLLRLPTPDLSQHPAMQPNPYTSTSDAPEMLTESKQQEIKDAVRAARRQFDAQQQELERLEAEQEEAQRVGTVRFKSMPKRGNAFALAAYNQTATSETELTPTPATMASLTTTPNSSTITSRPAQSAQRSTRQFSDPVNNIDFGRIRIDRDNDEVDLRDILKESSPEYLPSTHPTKSSFESSKNSTTPEGSEQKKSRLRKVSSRFGKPRVDSPVPDLPSPRDKESDLLRRPDLVSLLSSRSQVLATLTALTGASPSYHHKQSHHGL